MFQEARLTKTGEWFFLRRVERMDAGQFVCRVECEPPVDLVHTLVVQYPARVSMLAKS